MFQMQYSKYWAANDSFFTVSCINVYIVNKYLDTLGVQVRKMKIVFIDTYQMGIENYYSFFGLVIQVALVIMMLKSLLSARQLTTTQLTPNKLKIINFYRQYSLPKTEYKSQEYTNVKNHFHIFWLHTVYTPKYTYYLP